MKLFASFNISDVSAVSETSGEMHPAFMVLIGLVAIGFVIMIIQNFVIKKEEHYK